MLNKRSSGLLGRNGFGSIGERTSPGPVNDSVGGETLGLIDASFAFFEFVFIGSIDFGTSGFVVELLGNLDNGTSVVDGFTDISIAGVGNFTGVSNKGEFSLKQVFSVGVASPNGSFEDGCSPGVNNGGRSTGVFSGGIFDETSFENGCSPGVNNGGRSTDVFSGGVFDEISLGVSFPGAKTRPDFFNEGCLLFGEHEIDPDDRGGC